MKENRLVVADSGWAEAIPEWIKEEIRSDRLINGLIELGSGKKIDYDKAICDAEVVAYLYTAGLRGPMSTEFTNIYLYLSSKLMKKRNMDLPEKFEKYLSEGLNEYEQSELRDLKQMIFRSRGKVNHPLFDLLRELKDTKVKGGKK